MDNTKNALSELNDSLTNPKYKCSSWKFKTNRGIEEVAKPKRWTMIKFNDEQIQFMRDGYPPSEYDFEETITSMSYEVDELRKCLKVAEDALKKIDNMCDGDLCKFFDTSHHCSACKYLNECQTGVAHAALHEIREKGGAK